MDITVTAGNSGQLDEFYKREWAIVDRKHYGKDVSWESWTPKNFTIEARENNEIVGALSFAIHQDVSVIELFITAEKHRRKGIGELLLKKLEEISKEHKVHKIYLQTVRYQESYFRLQRRHFGRFLPGIRHRHENLRPIQFATHIIRGVQR